MITRYQDWQTRLDRFIRERRSLPFAWGVNDCCLFAADAAKAICGVDFMADFRGRYSDAEGALAATREFATRGDGLAEAFDSLLRGAGLMKITPSFAQTGDLLIFHPDAGSEEFGATCGISLGMNSAVMWMRGITLRPTLSAISAFRI